MWSVRNLFALLLGSLLSACWMSRVDGFSSTASFRPTFVSTLTTTKDIGLSSSRLYAGGFGGGGSSNKKKEKKGTSTKQLKPKQQWDRFLDMKKSPQICVGVRIKEDESSDWLEVGKIRTKDGVGTAVAVAMQRAIIAEHAKRLYPLQVSSKKTIEWGFLEDGGDWALADKSVLLEEGAVQEGVEKLIGFEGTPDPNTGFYCVYDGGKLKLGDETSFN